MSQNNKLILIIIGVLVIVGIVIALAVHHNSPTSQQQAAENSLYKGIASGSGATVATSATHVAAPTNVVVPNQGESSTPAGIAVPVIQGPAAPGVSASYRSFNISVDNNQFSPADINVNLGDTIDLEITAVDKDYAFTQPDYGFNDLLAKGKATKIQFQATTPGKFTFYCSTCGGPQSGPVGYLTVANPSQ